MRTISPKPVRYELIIYWSKDDESFVVEVPELPGCMADGQTYAEAVANAEVVIDEWIAVTQRNRARPGFQTARKLGRPIPEPLRQTRLRLRSAVLPTTCLPCRSQTKTGQP